MLNNTKLNYIMRKYRPIFRGVFGKNEFKDIKITGCPFCAISNESDFGTSGTHCVAVYFDVYGNCDYCDPYGDIPVAEMGLFIAYGEAIERIQ